MKTIGEAMEKFGETTHEAGVSKTVDVEDIEDESLVKSVSDRLSNLNEITGRKSDRNPAALDDDEDDPTPDEDDTEVNDDDSQADDSEKLEESTPDKDEEGMPDAYVRAAIHSGWKQEDIDAMVKADSKVAEKTLQNIYESTNKASREWAALGRARRSTEVKETVDKLEYNAIDIAALKKDSDIDPAVERILDSVNARDKQLVDALNNSQKDKSVDNSVRVERAVKTADLATEAAAEQQINGFFSADLMKPYSKFYGELRFGETWESLPVGQQRNRYAVFTTADQMLAGAAMQGYEMSLTDALDKAHLLITEGMREEVIRDGIKATATKRKNSMLLKPSNSKSKKDDGGGKPKNKNELISKTERLLAKTFKR